MIRFLPHLIAAGALLGAVGYVWALKADNRALRASQAVLEAQLAGCSARSDNITEDKESDDEIDRIPDADLRDRAGEWVFDPTGNPYQH